MKIVFFYSRIVNYVEGTFKALSRSSTDLSVDVVYWDYNKKLPHNLEDIDNTKFHLRSSIDVNGLYALLIETKPQILYISGWMDKDYILAAMKYKRICHDVKIVAGIDDQWHGTLKQYLGILVFKFKFKALFDYLWVTGSPQYHYARKMGYNDNEIIYNLYSADTSIFKDKAPFSKRIVFLGRFAHEKGIIKLIEEYKKLPSKLQEEWPLVLIGHGPLKESIINHDSKHITISPFLQSHELLNELNKGGIFCLPSNKEMWGVVIHELAILGYPLLLSSVCGANSEFLINGYNGFSFDYNQKDSILNAIIKITSLNQDEINLFSHRSHLLGKRINSELTVASLLSILTKTQTH